MKNKILILGASGFIGNKIYKELLPYFDVYGTYATSSPELEENQVMFSFQIEKDSIADLLNHIQPNFIISCLRGESNLQIKKHKAIIEHVSRTKYCKIIYLSTVNVFDAKEKYPSYENDVLSAKSDYGKMKHTIEKIISKLPKSKYLILRLPIVLGVNSPRIKQLKEASKNKSEFEIYPNLIISVTSAAKLVQQVHYIINKNLSGIFHLASNNIIHHAELFEEITKKLKLQNIIFKQIYFSEHDTYLAILPKYNPLPKNYQITIEEVIENCTLKEEITSLK